MEYCLKIIGVQFSLPDSILIDQVFVFRQRCDHDGGTLAKVSSLIEETVIHDFAVSYKQVLWIGLYSVQVRIYVNKHMI